MSDSMQYTRLGRSGLKISKVVLGCMSYGDKNWQPWVLNEEEGLPILKHACDCGINTFDVADTYSNGRSEEILGKFLREYNIDRRSVVIMSKVFNFVDETRGPIDAANMGNNSGVRVNRVGLSRKHILDAVEASTERLGTYIDVLQTHRLDRDTPMEEIMNALNDVVESGKARYIGASSMAAWEFQMLQTVAEKLNWHRLISMQDFHNLIYREEERETMPYCQATGVGYLPWSPLAAGVLAHAWHDCTDAREESDVFLKALFRGREEETDKAIVGRVEEVAAKKGISMAQVVIAWPMGKGELNPIMGLDTKDRIDQAVEGMRMTLTREEMEYLEEPYMAKNVSGY
ncbi:CSG1/SUR1-like protein [Vermiconidia calcicola]|uniref:CSG1/SUR1-like protein n=1 Tax=Vermiconidia calcicola TaxID=1690605 RepID=A0ACC3NYM9_9PEZI|nr:CSG1/SUR1-like protein [Vermiconidia calcicola]